MGGFSFGCSGSPEPGPSSSSGWHSVVALQSSGIDDAGLGFGFTKGSAGKPPRYLHKMALPITVCRDRPEESLKEACVACRAVKVQFDFQETREELMLLWVDQRKCIREEGCVECTRCSMLEQPCVYQQQRRGRKIKRYSPRLLPLAVHGPISEGDAAANLQASSSALLSTSAHTSPLHPTLTSRTPARPPPHGGFSLGDVWLAPSLLPSQKEPAPRQGGSLAVAFSKEFGLPGPSPMEPLYEDPLIMGLVAPEDVPALFDCFFKRLNSLIVLLDPIIHTPEFCRSTSLPLFTSILTVAAKLIRPDLYQKCLESAHRMVGQGFLFGLADLEFIQTLSLLAFWRDSADSRSWARIGYAIRVAFELRINRKTRPLPLDEKSARGVLNGERTWIHLCLADHHYAMQHSLPRMMDEREGRDVESWLNDHQHIAFQAELYLPGAMSLCVQLRTFDLVMHPESEGPPDARLWRWLTGEREIWRAKWLTANRYLDAVQLALLRFSDAVYGFQLAEVSVILASCPESGPSVFERAFGEWIDAALLVLSVVNTALGPLGVLPYAHDVIFVGSASACVWLAENSKRMSPADAALALAALDGTFDAMKTATTGATDMPGYSARLIDHLRREIYQAPVDTSPTTLIPPTLEDSTQTPDPEASLWSSGQGEERYDTSAFPSLALHHGPAPEYAFPPDDDDFWQSLFPMTRF